MIQWLSFAQVGWWVCGSGLVLPLHGTSAAISRGMAYPLADGAGKSKLFLFQLSSRACIYRMKNHEAPSHGAILLPFFGEMTRWLSQLQLTLEWKHMLLMCISMFPSETEKEGCRIIHDPGKWWFELTSQKFWLFFWVTAIDIGNLNPKLRLNLSLQYHGLLTVQRLGDPKCLSWTFRNLHVLVGWWRTFG